jgi:hypothetical protein
MPEDVARPLARRRRAEATALPPWTKPQLTKLDQPPEGSEWLHELKFDGCPRTRLCENRVRCDSPLEGGRFEPSVIGATCTPNGLAKK